MLKLTDLVDLHTNAHTFTKIWAEQVIATYSKKDTSAKISYGKEEKVNIWKIKMETSGKWDIQQ